MKYLFRIIALVGAVSAGSVAIAEPVLTVASGDGTAGKSYSLDELLAFEQVEIITGNDFVDGEKTFSGPLARTVLARVGGQAEHKIRLTAVNDYQVEFDASEFFEYDVIFALSQDGTNLSRRDKGPVWLIYPMSQHRELQDPVFNNRLIWQLVKVEYW